jgi:hypothetical protein
MDNRKFIRCRRCDAVHHVTFYDEPLLQASSSAAIKNISTDDWRRFMAQHAGHPLEPLRAAGELRFLVGSPSDPMAVAYLEVTNGQQPLLLRRSRSGITEPVRFERIDGFLSETDAGLAIQEAALRKELSLRFRCPDGRSLSAPQIELFIDLLRAVVRVLPPSELTVVEPSGDDDNTAYGALPASTRDLLLQQCAPCFSAAEVQALRAFIEAHRFGSDVMTVVLLRQFTVTQRP